MADADRGRQALGHLVGEDAAEARGVEEKEHVLGRRVAAVERLAVGAVELILGVDEAVGRALLSRLDREAVGDLIADRADDRGDDAGERRELEAPGEGARDAELQIKPDAGDERAVERAEADHVAGRHAEPGQIDAGDLGQQRGDLGVRELERVERGVLDRRLDADVARARRELVAHPESDLRGLIEQRGEAIEEHAVDLFGGIVGVDDHLVQEPGERDELAAPARDLDDGGAAVRTIGDDRDPLRIDDLQEERREHLAEGVAAAAAERIGLEAGADQIGVDQRAAEEPGAAVVAEVLDHDAHVLVLEQVVAGGAARGGPADDLGRIGDALGARARPRFGGVVAAGGARREGDKRGDSGGLGAHGVPPVGGLRSDVPREHGSRGGGAIRAARRIRS